MIAADEKSLCPGSTPTPLSRRDMLRASALGFGSLALYGMMAEANGQRKLAGATQEPPTPTSRLLGGELSVTLEDRPGGTGWRVG